MSDTLAPAHRFPFAQHNGDPLVPATVPGSDGWAGWPCPPAGAWLFTRHEHLRELLRSPDFSSDFTRPGFPLIRPMPQDMRPARTAR